MYFCSGSGSIWILDRPMEGEEIPILSEQIHAYHSFILTAPISTAAAGFSFLNSMQFRITHNLQ